MYIDVYYIIDSM